MTALNVLLWLMCLGLLTWRVTRKWERLTRRQRIGCILWVVGMLLYFPVTSASNPGRAGFVIGGIGAICNLVGLVLAGFVLLEEDDDDHGPRGGQLSRTLEGIAKWLREQRSRRLIPRPA